MSKGGIMVLIPSAQRTLDERQKDIVALLEQVLDEARAGLVQSFILVTETDETYESRASGSSDTAKLVGMCEMAKHNYLHGSGE